ncbi:hypothetical protein LAZ67_14000307 [Cordylochernes scorpioides]|uniref:Uncharacterized protein n=1 Tax=Cordylochernes scorpioides TaxID=51811 RepID=A0ABY6L5H4_9ARAC|nr:hypothetical protein LAZ67_14000307 [Cordylochernes scorpioides]
MYLSYIKHPSTVIYGIGFIHSPEDTGEVVLRQFIHSQEPDNRLSPVSTLKCQLWVTFLQITSPQISPVVGNSTGPDRHQVLYKGGTAQVAQVFETLALHATVGGRTYELGLFDTAGQEDYDRLRPLSYQGASVFLVCCSVVDPRSVISVTDKWLTEVSMYCPRASVLIVGTKTDLRDSEPVALTESEGFQLSQKSGADGYVECSSLKQVMIYS